MVVFIFAGLYACGKNNGSSTSDNTDSTESSEITTSETESSEITSSTVVSETEDNSEESEDSQESSVSTPDDGRIEELEEEITRLNASLSEANSEIETQQGRIKDLEKQLDESSQIDNSLVKTIHMRGGACLYLYGLDENYCKKLIIVHADKSVHTIFNDRLMTTIKPSPDGSKVIMNNFEMDYHSQVFIYDVDTNTTKDPLMSVIPAGYTASFMEWLDSRYFLFVVQYDQGTVVRGGDVYVYDTQTDNYRLLLAREDKAHQICSFAVYPDDIVTFKAMYRDKTVGDFNKDVYYSVTVDEIYNLINSNKTMTLKAENEIYSQTLETNVNIAYASENILRQYKSFDEFTDNCGSESIIFYTNAPVKDFCYISVTWDVDKDNPFEIRNPKPQDILYSTEQVVLGKPLVIKNTYINEIDVSNRGIKFTDENNKVRYFYIIYCGRDGLTLVEFTNEIK
jgi:hypothetical protein